MILQSLRNQTLNLFLKFPSGNCCEDSLFLDHLDLKEFKKNIDKVLNENRFINKKEINKDLNEIKLKKFNLLLQKAQQMTSEKSQLKGTHIVSLMLQKDEVELLRLVIKGKNLGRKKFPFLYDFLITPLLKDNKPNKLYLVKLSFDLEQFAKQNSSVPKLLLRKVNDMLSDESYAINQGGGFIDRCYLSHHKCIESLRGNKITLTKDLSNSLKKLKVEILKHYKRGETIFYFSHECKPHYSLFEILNELSQTTKKFVFSSVKDLGDGRRFLLELISLAPKLNSILRSLKEEKEGEEIRIGNGTGLSNFESYLEKFTSDKVLLKKQRLKKTGRGFCNRKSFITRRESSIVINKGDTKEALNDLLDASNLIDLTKEVLTNRKKFKKTKIQFNGVKNKKLLKFVIPFYLECTKVEKNNRVMNESFFNQVKLLQTKMIESYRKGKLSLIFTPERKYLGIIFQAFQKYSKKKEVGIKKVVLDGKENRLNIKLVSFIPEINQFFEGVLKKRKSKILSISSIGKNAFFLPYHAKYVFPFMKGVKPKKSDKATVKFKQEEIKRMLKVLNQEVFKVLTEVQENIFYKLLLKNSDEVKKKIKSQHLFHCKTDLDDKLMLSKEVYQEIKSLQLVMLKAYEGHKETFTFKPKEEYLGFLFQALNSISEKKSGSIKKVHLDLYAKSLKITLSSFKLQCSKLLISLGKKSKNPDELLFILPKGDLCFILPYIKSAFYGIKEVQETKDRSIIIKMDRKIIKGAEALVRSLWNDTAFLSCKACFVFGKEGLKKLQEDHYGLDAAIVRNFDLLKGFFEEIEQFRGTLKTVKEAEISSFLVKLKDNKYAAILIRMLNGLSEKDKKASGIKEVKYSKGELKVTMLP